MDTYRLSAVLTVGMLWTLAGCGGSSSNTYDVDVTDYRDPPLKFSMPDDVLDPRRLPAFDPLLVHGDPVEGWELNLSRTAFRLDVPVVNPEWEPDLLQLRPTYAAAIQAARERNAVVLPSVNLIDGKAKQFDDGLYAALDLAYYFGREPVLLSHVELVRRMADAVGPQSVAAPYLAAGLSLAKVDVPAEDAAAKGEYLRKFEESPLRSKPLGFYNWSPRLRECYRFLKFFQEPFPIANDRWPAVARALADVLQRDAKLREDYQQAIDFYARLTNPPVALSLLDVTDDADATAAIERQRSGNLRPGVAVFPASTSREQRLFERLFPLGFPEGVDLMRVLMESVRKGDVDLAPTPQSGWYDHQCYALETFLLPQRGDESRKLVLTARYKQRMFDAFAVLITKRRETHIRQLETPAAEAAPAEPYAKPDPLPRLAPRLRLEPNATYYLRTARAYTFVQTFLDQAVGREPLSQIKGLRDGGERGANLASELAAMRELFYGCYLLAVEDLGLPSALTAEELPDPAAARERALAWIADFAADSDLAVDTRVAVPIAIDPFRGTTQIWGTTGVRLARLTVDFAGNAPSVRPAGSSDEWKRFEGELDSTGYLMAVDEFVSAEISSLDCPTRDEFRRLCDQAGTSEKVREALTKR